MWEYDNLIKKSRFAEANYACFQEKQQFLAEKVCCNFTEISNVNLCLKIFTYLTSGNVL